MCCNQRLQIGSILGMVQRHSRGCISTLHDEAKVQRTILAEVLRAFSVLADNPVDECLLTVAHCHAVFPALVNHVRKNNKSKCTGFPDSGTPDNPLNVSWR